MSNLEVIKQYHQTTWAEKDLNAIDSYFSDEALIHSQVEAARDIEKMKFVIQQWYQAFPDLTVTFEDYICEDNKVVSRWKARGTQSGDFLGHPASNKEVNYSGMTIFELTDGKITQYWCEINMAHVFSQL